MHWYYGESAVIYLLSFVVDIDECMRGTHDCHDNATCTNTEGSYECDCIEGYMGNGTYCESKYALVLNRNSEYTTTASNSLRNM